MSPRRLPSSCPFFYYYFSFADASKWSRQRRFGVIETPPCDSFVRSPVVGLIALKAPVPHVLTLFHCLFVCCLFHSFYACLVGCLSVCVCLSASVAIGVQAREVPSVSGAASSSMYKRTQDHPDSEVTNAFRGGFPERGSSHIHANACALE